MIEQLLPNKIFIENNKPNISVGNLCWIPVMQKDEQYILEIKRNPTKLNSHNDIDFKVTPINATHFTRNHEDQLPVVNLRLEKNQELLINPAKKRLCLIIGSNNIPNYDLTQYITHISNQQYANHLSNKTFMAVPLYSCSTSLEPTSFCEEMTDRIKNFIYHHLFYLPKYKDITGSFSALKELSNSGSILRLDEIFTFQLNTSIKAIPYSVSPEVLKLIFIHFQSIYGSPDNFKKFKDSLM